MITKSPFVKVPYTQNKSVIFSRKIVEYPKRFLIFDPSIKSNGGIKKDTI